MEFRLKENTATSLIVAEKNPLFEERTPEAAAIHLAIVLAHAAECELATLEELKHRKRASKYDIRRHELIAAELIFNCADLNVPPKGLMGRVCNRLQEALLTPKSALLQRLGELRKWR